MGVGGSFGYDLEGIALPTLARWKGLVRKFNAVLRRLFSRTTASPVDYFRWYGIRGFESRAPMGGR